MHELVTKDIGTTIDDAEDLDLVLPMYNLLEYSSNYSDSTDGLWFCIKDFNANIANNATFSVFRV